MSTRLYLGHLSRDVRRSDIEDLFKGYGRLIDVRIMGSFGFAEFEHHRDAEDACKDFDGKNFMGERIIVQPAKVSRQREGGGFEREPHGRNFNGSAPRGHAGGPPPPRSAPRMRRGQFRLIISNLPPNTSWQDLKDIGREHGSISFADVDPQRPEEGIIEYDGREDYERALEKMDGTELRGFKLRVDPSRRDAPRDDRERDRERSPPPPPKRREESPPPRRREDSREPPPSRNGRYDSRSPPPRRERDYDERPPRDD